MHTLREWGAWALAVACVPLLLGLLIPLRVFLWLVGHKPYDAIAHAREGSRGR